MAYSLITVEKAKSPISEAYRTLRTNIQFTSIDEEMKIIMVTSSGPREGKSSTLANLGVSIAETGKSVLIVDADLRNPTQHKIFGLDNSEGLSMSLVLDKPFNEYIQQTRIPGLKVMTGGPVPPNPAELVGSNKMSLFIKKMADKFDVVLIDTPPVIAVADASILAREVDGVLLVVASGEVNRDFAQRAKEQLDKVGAKIIGAVLNKMDIKTSEYYYYYYYHGDDKTKSNRD